MACIRKCFSSCFYVLCVMADPHVVFPGAEAPEEHPGDQLRRLSGPHGGSRGPVRRPERGAARSQGHSTLSLCLLLCAVCRHGGVVVTRVAGSAGAESVLRRDH